MGRFINRRRTKLKVLSNLPGRDWLTRLPDSLATVSKVDASLFESMGGVSLKGKPSMKRRCTVGVGEAASTRIMIIMIEVTLGNRTITIRPGIERDRRQLASEGRFARGNNRNQLCNVKLSSDNFLFPHTAPLLPFRSADRVSPSVFS